MSLERQLFAHHFLLRRNMPEAMVAMPSQLMVTLLIGKER